MFTKNNFSAPPIGHLNFMAATQVMSQSIFDMQNNAYEPSGGSNSALPDSRAGLNSQPLFATTPNGSIVLSPNTPMDEPGNDALLSFLEASPFENYP